MNRAFCLRFVMAANSRWTSSRLKTTGSRRSRLGRGTARQAIRTPQRVGEKMPQGITHHDATAAGDAPVEELDEIRANIFSANVLRRPSEMPRKLGDGMNVHLDRAGREVLQTKVFDVTLSQRSHRATFLDALVRHRKMDYETRERKSESSL